MKIRQITSCFNSREHYVASCRDAVVEFSAKCKKLEWQYVYKHDRYYSQTARDEDGLLLVDEAGLPVVATIHEKSGPRVGVIAAYLTSEDKLFMGASRCNLSCDVFDRYIGLYRALLTARPVIGLEISEIFRPIPQSLHKAFAHVFDRFHQLAEC